MIHRVVDRFSGFFQMTLSQPTKPADASPIDDFSIHQHLSITSYSSIHQNSLTKLFFDSSTRQKFFPLLMLTRADLYPLGVFSVVSC